MPSSTSTFRPLSGRPFVVGLTGSIAMGKSETAKMFQSLGVPVYDADAVVGELYAPGGAAVTAIAAAFPGVVDAGGGIDRVVLSKLVLGDKVAVSRLEDIVHPFVEAGRRDFLKTAISQAQALVVMDIPLLFETGGEERVEAVVVVSAPADMQRERALVREGMTEEKFESILALQMPDEEKRERADYIVDSSQGLDYAFKQVKKIVAQLREQAMQRN
ncbi:MAG: dephospho-CoA kinase [Parvularculales bacterium]